MAMGRKNLNQEEEAQSRGRTSIERINLDREKVMGRGEMMVMGGSESISTTL
jgi:hypothetical protein